MYYDYLEPVAFALIEASRRLATHLPYPESDRAAARLDQLEAKFANAHTCGDQDELRKVIAALVRYGRQLSARSSVPDAT